MSNIIPFPRPRPLPWLRFQTKSSGMRVALLDGRWCIEQLVVGDVIDRRFMPTQADAERIARRICRRDKLQSLTARRRRPRPWPNFYQHNPDDAA